MRRIVYSQELEGRLTATGPGLADVELACAGETPLGPAPTLSSQLEFATERSFSESGTIAFGGEPALRFATRAPGTLSGGPGGGVRRGSAVLDVWGLGALDGARGRITSNFVLTDDGAFADRQVVELLLDRPGGTVS